MEKIDKKILVPMDGSEQSQKALAEAVKVAQQEGAELFVFTAAESAAKATSDARAYEYLTEIADEQLAETLKIAEKDIPEVVNYTTYKVKGNPKAEIVKFAEDKGIDLIIMGATGKGAIGKLLVGSTTSFVVNNAPCNVMVIK